MLQFKLLNIQLFYQRRSSKIIDQGGKTYDCCFLVCMLDFNAYIVHHILFEFSIYIEKGKK